ncbi:class I SAM-dependent methyltransferase [Candidatus Parcubacteria bacterium]|nr:class I SAM-dependent methyltransferase [Candidatus Parcubacteria bacterium]
MRVSSNLEKYQSKNFLKRAFIKRFIRQIVEIVQSLKISGILDAGCGEGLIIHNILRKIPKVKIDAFDISEQALENAKKILPNNNFFQGDITDIKLPSNDYDLIIALEILEHLENPEAALRELKRATKKYCLISVPWEPFFSLGNLSCGKNIKRIGKDKEHLQFWNKKEIVGIVEKYFDIISVKISFPWTIILGEKK